MPGEWKLKHPWRGVICLCLSLGFAPAQSPEAYSIRPASIHQGEVWHVTGPSEAKAVRVAGRTVPVYPNVSQRPNLSQRPDDSQTSGLVPVAVLTKPGIYRMEWLDEKGQVLHAKTVTILNAHYPRQNIVLSPRLANLHSTPEERDDVGEFLKNRSPARSWEEPLEAPIPGCITSMFGVSRWHNGKPTGEFHGGLDQRGAAGTPIHAIAGGEVKLAQQFELRGGTVAIDHGQGMQSIYLHMSSIAAHPGERVAKGDVIGYVGSTGRSTAPHLHWSIYVQGEPVNPLQWMKLVPCTTPRKAD